MESKSVLASKIEVGSVGMFIVTDKFKNEAKDLIGINLFMAENFMRWVIDPLKDKRLNLISPVLLDKIYFKGGVEQKNFIIEAKSIYVKTFVPILWKMLWEQHNGEKGNLLVNGSANRFHVQLENGRDISVQASFVYKCWVLGAWEELVFDERFFNNCCFFKQVS